MRTKRHYHETKSCGRKGTNKAQAPQDTTCFLTYVDWFCSDGCTHVAEVRHCVDLLATGRPTMSPSFRCMCSNAVAIICAELRRKLADIRDMSTISASSVSPMLRTSWLNCCCEECWFPAQYKSRKSGCAMSLSRWHVSPIYYIIHIKHFALKEDLTIPLPFPINVSAAFNNLLLLFPTRTAAFPIVK